MKDSAIAIAEFLKCNCHRTGVLQQGVLLHFLILGVDISVPEGYVVAIGEAEERNIFPYFASERTFYSPIFLNVNRASRAGR
jgi:hypothetical protein